MFYDEKTCPLMPPVATGDDNSKMADISVTWGMKWEAPDEQVLKYNVIVIAS